MSTPAYDLRAFFSALGGVAAHRGGVASDERVDTRADVEVYDDTPAAVSADPLEVSGYVDGIQASACVAYFDHRPVHLVYTGAARMSPRLEALQVAERLSLVCGHDDEERLSAISQGLPVVAIPSADPQELERLVRSFVDTARRECEAEVVAEVTEPVVVDGDLRERPKQRSLVGVAKTLRTRYLPKEDSLVDLPHGWRSEKFKISTPNGEDRYSCYLRLLDASDEAWSYGLIRLETYEPGWLEPLAALCLRERQGSRSGDRRYDTHLAPIRACEELLRARRPAAFSHL